MYPHVRVGTGMGMVWQGLPQHQCLRTGKPRPLRQEVAADFFRETQGSPGPLQASGAAPVTPGWLALLLKETTCKQPAWAPGRKTPQSHAAAAPTPRDAGGGTSLAPGSWFPWRQCLLPAQVRRGMCLQRGRLTIGGNGLCRAPRWWWLTAPAAAARGRRKRPALVSPGCTWQELCCLFWFLRRGVRPPWGPAAKIAST